MFFKGASISHHQIKAVLYFRPMIDFPAFGLRLHIYDIDYLKYDTLGVKFIKRYISLKSKFQNDKI